MEDNREVKIDVWSGKIAISIPGMHKLAFVDYTPKMYDMMTRAKFRIPTEEAKEKYKYPYSNEYNKGLHQISFDSYFGENIRTDAYSKNYIIEHLDNDGFNCCISNLFLLKKIKNTYKGWHFDKVVEEAKYIAAMTIFHVIENRTFQITIAFNETYENNSGEVLSKVCLLYPYDYEIVLQDAEQIIEAISNREMISLSKWKELYRFKDIHVEYAPEGIELTEDECKQGPGTMIFRDGQPYFLIGRNDDAVGIITSTPYKKNWNID